MSQLDAARTKYNTLKAEIDEIQGRATDRDLTDAELGEIQTRSAEATKLSGTIDTLEAADKLVTRSALISNTTAVDRDPGTYTRGSKNSFFGDMTLSRMGDHDAADRLAVHSRALSTSSAGTGIVPPKWLTDEFEAVARQGRSVANVVRNVALTDPRPMTLPKQTAVTDGVVGVQSAENAATSYTDAYDTDVVTVTPATISGGQIFSRQFLESSNPSIDALIYGDLLAAYNQQVEAKVVTAMVASGGTPAVVHATNAAWKTNSGDSVIDGAIAVRSARKLPADILVMNVARYGEYLKLKDVDGRPLIPLETAGPINVIGTGSVQTDGRVAGLSVFATDGVASTFPENILVARSQDVVLFESPVRQFRFEEVQGPESIKIGIWAYNAVYVKYAGASVKLVRVTAAS